MRTTIVLILFFFLAYNMDGQDLLYSKNKAVKAKEFSLFSQDSIEKLNSLDLESMMSRNAAFSTLINGKASSMFSDIATDKIRNSKIALSAALTNAKGDTIRDIHSLLSMGGNLSLRCLTNLFSYKKGFDAAENTFQFILHPKLSFNIPTGNGNETFTGNLDTGIEFLFNVTAKERKLAIVGKMRSALVYGTKDFTANVAFNGRQFFTYGQATLGLVVLEKVVIIATFPVAFNPKDPIDKVGNSISMNMLF
jgi:hypothetical protein